MAQCPVCQAENADDFGLVNCHSCGSPFFIDMDGVASSSPAMDAAVSTEEPMGFAEPAQPDPVESEMQSLTEPPILENFEAEPEPQFDFSQNDDSQAEGSEEPNMPSAEADALFESATPEPPLEDLREIARFGNSEESLAREGAYRITIYIRGIDTAEIRQEVRHQLNDSRFLWDIDALLDSIVDGELVLKDISAVKAALAVQRLKTLPVELKWEQHALHRNPTP